MSNFTILSRVPELTHPCPNSTHIQVPHFGTIGWTVKTRGFKTLKILIKKKLCKIHTLLKMHMARQQNFSLLRNGQSRFLWKSISNVEATAHLIFFKLSQQGDVHVRTRTTIQVFGFNSKLSFSLENSSVIFQGFATFLN